MSLLLTQPSSQYPPLVDASDTLDSPLTIPRKKTSDTARLVSEGYINRDHITAADDKLFGVYRDWVHQNPGTHLDVGIE